MRIKRMLAYGMRLIFFLAMNDGVYSSREIAEAINVPRDYLIQIAQELRNGGIIEAKPGKNGGYTLAKDPSEITLYEIISLLDEETSYEHDTDSDHFKSQTPEMQSVLRAINSFASGHDAYLNTITLEMVISSSKDLDNIEQHLSEYLMAGSEAIGEKSLSEVTMTSKCRP